MGGKGLSFSLYRLSVSRISHTAISVDCVPILRRSQQAHIEIPGKSQAGIRCVPTPRILFVKHKCRIVKLLHITSLEVIYTVTPIFMSE